MRGDSSLGRGLQGSCDAGRLALVSPAARTCACLMTAPELSREMPALLRNSCAHTNSQQGIGVRRWVVKDRASAVCRAGRLRPAGQPPQQTNAPARRHRTRSSLPVLLLPFSLKVREPSGASAAATVCRCEERLLASSTCTSHT